MKILKFKDQFEANLADTSTILDCVTVLNSFAEVDAIRAEFTEDNLKGATFDGEVVENVIPVSASASADVDGNVVVHFINRAKTHDEIVDEQIAEMQLAMAEIAVPTDSVVIGE